MAIKIKIVADYDQRGMTQATRALDDFGKKAQLVLGAVAVATAALAVKSVQEFTKFEGALNQSLAIMGNVSDAMKGEMADAAREMAKATTFSAEQAAESYFFLASAGLDAEASVAAMPEVAKFAQAGMFDMARATDLLTDAQSALGLTIRDDAIANMNNMSRVSDVLVKANTLANASVEQFSVALTSKAGPALKTVGKDIEEGVAVLAALADQGIKAELAGNGLTIALRDLQTKAIENKDAFTETGIAVFDTRGEMRNMADIIADLETATAGMSDEQKKATFGMLGFADRSFATIAALLGTSEQIRIYEAELRKAGGTTDEVANKQLQSFESQLKLLESAVTDVFIEIGQQLTPALSDLVERVKELLPEIGTKLVEAIKKVDFAKIVEDIGDFVVLIVDNLDNIAKMGEILLGVAAALAIYTAAAGVARTATALLSSTLTLSPVGIAITLIAGLTWAVTQLAEANEKAKEGIVELSDEERKRQKELKYLRGEQERLQREIENSTGYLRDNYIVQLKRVQMQLIRTGYAAEESAGEINRMNNLRLDALIRQANRARDAFREVVFTGAGGTADWLNQMFGTGPGGAAGSSSGGGGGGGGKSAYQEARDRVQEIIKDGQKRLRDAQVDYNNMVKKANEDYAQSVINLQETFANKLADIVRQSQDRLRNAYKSAVAVNLSSLFQQDEEKSVTGLVSSLKDKLTASRNLLSNAAKLASNGFSQTFIEQIVSAGTDTGNELATAILESSPKTQAELQDLFVELEKTSESGMDKLAQKIYDKQGLATQALKDLYVTTEMELAEALLDQQDQLALALEDAAQTFRDTVKEIRESVTESIEDMDGQLGGLIETVDMFLKKLAKLEGAQIPDVAVKTPKAPKPVSVSSAVIAFQPEPVATPTPKPAPVINVNVKTDQTQSTAQVGAIIAQTINKYSNTGGIVVGGTGTRYIV